MSTRKLTKTLNKLLRQMRRMARGITKGFVNWILRGLLTLSRQPLLAKSGFVLPTTILLLLVLTLTVGAISLRTFTRTSDTLGERQQRVIYNAATPAIDRAKAKIEYMFDDERETRLPLPPQAEADLLSIMANDGVEFPAQFLSDGSDPYTFPQGPSFTAENRLDLNNDGALDNAWSYQVDSDDDGQMDAWVAYSILFDIPDNQAELADQRPDALAQRAANLQVRSGPLSNVNVSQQCATEGGGSYEGGWLTDPSQGSLRRKNFQVTAYVVPIDPATGTVLQNATVSTLEFQQDRQVQVGNKWGAWFRTDLEVFPGPRFNWNGAMHTEGNLIVGNSNFRGFLISSPASCLYPDPNNSKVTVTELRDYDGNPDNGEQIFQGQFISGKVNANQFGGDNRFHILDFPDPIDGGDDTRFRDRNDSVNNNPVRPAGYTLDPVVLVTENLNVHRDRNNLADNDSTRYRDAGWNQDDSPFLDPDRPRMENQKENPPYVDDAYRADNRYGPLPRYGTNVRTPIPGNIGEEIAGNPMEGDNAPTEEDMISDVSTSETSDDEYGLDGYWERRARGQGMTLIVSQRLELGNMMGWGGVVQERYEDGGARGLVFAERDDEDLAAQQEPLNPWLTCEPPGLDVNRNRCNEARQRRNLRDNLAAVQSMAVYRYDAPEPELPVACLALTVHPGTHETLSRAATFENLDPYRDDADPLFISDFFHGRGTNGWEYEVPALEDLRNSASPLRRAMRNLAYYAGDPRSGAPSFTPVQDEFVHPYPAMAEWGDYSILRRVLDINSPNTPAIDDDGLDYDALSPADRATLQTTACTLGMLAYQIDYLNEFSYATDPNTNDMELLGALLRALQPGSDDGALETAINGYQGNIWGNRPVKAPAANFEFDPAVHTPDNYLHGLMQWRDNTGGAALARMNDIVDLAQIVMNKEQVVRDRENGFQYEVAPTLLDAANSPTLAGDDAQTDWCGLGVTTFGTAFPTHGVGMAELCPRYPKYPVLFSLFPTDDHRDLAGGENGTRDWEVREGDTEPTHEINGYNVTEYINDVNGTDEIYEAFTDADIEEMMLEPLPLANWNLPNENAGTGDVPNHAVDVRIKECVNERCGGTTQEAALIDVPFKDTAPMNGRAMMPVRLLNINVELLNTTRYDDSTSNPRDFWLPAHTDGDGDASIVFAFREDAVREDSITRPTDSNWATCGSDAQIQSVVNCQMGTMDNNAYESSDPPLFDENLISLKPADYVPDPDRRPYGFRIRKGSDIHRGELRAGLTFVTDQPIYLQGDLNLHQNETDDQIEEFREILNAGNFNNFYDRDTLDNRFARASSDFWRPMEFISDAVTVLPDNFCDGSLEDIYDDNLGNSERWYGCRNNGDRTSYLNYNLPNREPDRLDSNDVPEDLEQRWARENPFACMLDDGDCDGSPVLVGRNGNPFIPEQNRPNIEPYGTDRGGYRNFGDNKNLIRAQETRQNVVFVSALTPSRPNQSYGGLHNFPRFITDWGGRNLFISGSLIQLTLSKYATAPFSQNAWEPDDRPGNRELIKYYVPPNRRWGYDVALQYFTPGPLSRRFTSPGTTYNEFYNEPPADDPYVQSLCNGLQDDEGVDITCD